jgi:inorganic triphosphatase YgiF
VRARSESWSISPAQFAAESLSARLKTLLEQVGRCAGEADVDAVHDLRVSIRRFSQGLRIFGSLLERKSVKEMRSALKDAMDAAARLRDLDVGIELLRKEGLGFDHAVIGEMREERRLGEMALQGRLLLLRSIEPERNWPEKLRLREHA